MKVAKPKRVLPNAGNGRRPQIAVLIALSISFLFLVSPSLFGQLPFVGPDLAKISPFVAIIPLAAAGWVISQRWGALICALGFTALLFLGPAMVLAVDLRQSLTLCAAAVVGSILGGMTYLSISLLGTWNELRDQRRRANNRELYRHKKEYRKIEERLDILVTGTNNLPPKTEGSSDIRENIEAESQDEATPNEVKSKAEEHRRLSSRCAELERTISGLEVLALREPDWQEVWEAISWKLRFFRIPMAIGIAIGLAFLGKLAGIKALGDPGREGNIWNVIGVFFLVGLYPRVFERLLKGLADRLTSQKTDPAIKQED